MGRSYQCTRLTSTCYFKPLTVVASYQISAHRHREENDEDSTLPDLDYVEDSNSDSDSEDEDNDDNDKSISVGSLQTNTFGASTISSTMASHHAVLETERNKHQITSQKLEIATIHLERAKRELEMSMENTKTEKRNNSLTVKCDSSFASIHPCSRPRQSLCKNHRVSRAQNLSTLP